MKHGILIYEDNKAFADSLSLLINSTDDISCLQVFNNPTTILKAIEEHNPSMILMDIDMPEMDGITAVKIAKEKYPDIPIVMQTIFEQNEKIYECTMNGANGYILKKSGPEKYLDSIRDVIEGGAPMSTGIAKKVMQLVQAPPSKKKEQLILSKREQEILSALVDGLSYKMIATKLEISYHTVNAHIRKIYEKLHVHNATEAVAMAIREKLLSFSTLAYLICKNEELLSIFSS